ncbi:hypothetical protein PILCRDRAFT_723912 [Piloderma croceum F 1598]|uniref:Uncharacterized protein n=1 Tax=Piloderma croceum (strain F 1598) TaxID=765440 RepID=A0A0C3EM62_PILCF|nr:hypothetical protein PILCRDRAFT_723912 [Piloderma croceum F 1598]
MACVYAGGGRTPGAVKFDFDIIRELRVWTIRIWTDNLRPKTRISKRDYNFAKGKKTHTKRRDAVTQTSIAPMCPNISSRLRYRFKNGCSVCF